MNSNRMTQTLRHVKSSFYLIFLLSLFFCKPEGEQNDFYTGPLTTVGGDVERLESFQGKVLVLDFWATWCEPCAKAVPTINQWKSSVSEKDFVFRGINTDTSEPIEKIKKDMERLKMSYPTLLDKDWKLTDFYHVEGIPCLLVFDRSGKIVYRQYGLVGSDLSGLVIRSHVWAASELP
ncbi:TlpA family protein disulfide reductase [Leptospira sp. 2 VSF19]|uniref:TlpA family protein disulfide reductase n=1 Tax=Leptospira soteropolitanensis TaxID=2950025 RepID=A0AAW5VEB7_9LEPT|nr:TlpA disulfide reductase family protein [Leptospira soteropolitanensis]MCW7492243.1 TlpA family protein disulfide reductase [Leptospira soteropolitanensis]MCW7499825.1 TlpA family protein disulfide reductase [Leptospira soteropolitanensis]MCW7525930.1 TlpA family protein disulfide reductase [Leptospira soteropolitanensis]MCW7529956.1 TlpA family protein disulfide reductase [Leptospira soteropolitanensis]